MRIGNSIYLDHQATTPVDSKVFDEMMAAQSEVVGNPHSVDHSLGWAAAQTVEKAAARIARLIGADEDEIVFTSGATESNNLALLGCAHGNRNGGRRRIVICATEHKCILGIAHILQTRMGYQVDKVAVDQQGFVILEELANLLDDDVLAVSVMAVNNEIGTIQDIKGISSLAHKVGAVMHCDAAQAPMAMRLDDIADCVDTLSLSGHKMYGPKGIGVLYVNRALQGEIEPIFYGGGQQGGLRAGTLPVPLCVGMAAAADIFTHPTVDSARNQLAATRDLFVQRLLFTDWDVAINGPAMDARHPGNANVRFNGFSAKDILGALQPHVAASTGSACTSGISAPSHVLMALGLRGDEAESSIRFSLGFDTTEDDIETAIFQICKVLDRLSNS